MSNQTDAIETSEAKQSQIVEPQPSQGGARRLFDLAGAAKYLVELGAEGVTIHSVRRLVANRELPVLKISKKFFITREAIDSWIARQGRRSR